MIEEMLQKAMAPFDTPEKWNAFRELARELDNIRNRWYKKLQQKLVSMTLADNAHPEWTCGIWNAWDIEWKLKGYESRYASLHSWAGFNCRLWMRNADEGKRRKVYEFLDGDDRYAQITSFYDIVNVYSRPNEVPWDAHFRFDFTDSLNGNWEELARSFAWYAGHDTDNVAQQIMAQVDKVRTPEMTDLFRAVNKLLNEEET